MPSTTRAASERLERVKERIARRSSPSFPTECILSRIAARVKANLILSRHFRRLDSRHGAVFLCWPCREGMVWEFLHCHPTSLTPGLFSPSSAKFKGMQNLHTLPPKKH